MSTPVQLMRLVPLLLLLLLPPLLPLCSAQQCTTKDGKLWPRGHVVQNPDDACLSDVCRCASEDRCVMISERRMVQVRVNEDKYMGPDKPPQTNKLLLQCTCVDHLPGSSEMDFTCKSPTQPGRDVGVSLIGCPDSNGALRLPGQKVNIRNSRGEALECDCNNKGHYFNCLPEAEASVVGTCLDSATNTRVPLGSAYYRLHSSSSGLPLRLRCVCARADMETSCTLA